MWCVRHRARGRLDARLALARSEAVAVGAARRWVCDPLSGRSLYQLAEHILELTTARGRRGGCGTAESLANTTTL
jgi:hypothetical protein